MSKYTKIVSKKARVLLFDQELELLAENFCIALRRGPDYSSISPCIYWREAAPGVLSDANFGAQFRAALNCADSIEVRGHQIYLDLPDEKLDDLAGMILFWDKGIKFRKFSFD